MALLPGQTITFPPCPWTARMKERRAEFLRDIAPELVAYTWGPDHFGYESSTEMYQRSDGVIEERNILIRITDLSRYSARWREFMGYNVPTINGEIRPIPERVIVNEEEGSPLCPIDVSSDEEEEFVPANMSDDEDDE